MLLRILLAPLLFILLMLTLLIASPDANSLYEVAFAKARAKLPESVVTGAVLLSMVRTVVWCKLDYIGCVKNEISRFAAGVEVGRLSLVPRPILPATPSPSRTTHDPLHLPTAT